MQRMAKALLCTTMLFIFNHQIVASESNDITIRIQIFPPQAKTDSITNNWTVELQFIRKIMIEEPNGSTSIINEQIVGRKGKVTNNEGKISWITSVVKKLKESDKHKQIRYYYKVVCYGGWAYSDGSSKELDAEIPNVYEVTIYMKRK